MATRPAIAPLPAMPTSIDFVLSQMIPERDDRTRGRSELRVQRHLGEEVVRGAERRTGVEPEPADPQQQDAEAHKGHRVPGDRPRLAVGAVLAAPRSEEQQRRKAADRTGEVDHRRTGEVHDRLAADVGQEAAAVDGVRHERVDHRGEDDRVDHVGGELDPLERRSPDDRQRDRAEQQPEQHQRPDRSRDRRSRYGVSARPDRLADVEEEPVRAEDARSPSAKRDPEADRPPGERRDREVDDDLGDAGSHVLLAGEADLEQQEPSLHAATRERSRPSPM